tara:strand:+ start:2497 stop:5598 length:3102 start_codon:yes stop_codon:yes gene_type:complete
MLSIHKDTSLNFKGNDHRISSLIRGTPIIESFSDFGEGQEPFKPEELVLKTPTVEDIVPYPEFSSGEISDKVLPSNLDVSTLESDVQTDARAYPMANSSPTIPILLYSSPQITQPTPAVVSSQTAPTDSTIQPRISYSTDSSSPSINYTQSVEYESTDIQDTITYEANPEPSYSFIGNPAEFAEPQYQAQTHHLPALEATVQPDLQIPLPNLLPETTQLFHSPNIVVGFDDPIVKAQFVERTEIYQFETQEPVLPQARLPDHVQSPQELYVEKAPEPLLQTEQTQDNYITPLDAHQPSLEVTIQQQSVQPILDHTQLSFDNPRYHLENKEPDEYREPEEIETNPTEFKQPDNNQYREPEERNFKDQDYKKPEERISTYRPPQDPIQTSELTQDLPKPIEHPNVYQESSTFSEALSIQQPDTQDMDLPTLTIDLQPTGFDDTVVRQLYNDLDIVPEVEHDYTETKKPDYETSKPREDTYTLENPTVEAFVTEAELSIDPVTYTEPTPVSIDIQPYVELKEITVDDPQIHNPNPTIKSEEYQTLTPEYTEVPIDTNSQPYVHAVSQVDIQPSIELPQDIIITNEAYRSIQPAIDIQPSTQIYFGPKIDLDLDDLTDEVEVTKAPKEAISEPTLETQLEDGTFAILSDRVLSSDYLNTFLSLYGSTQTIEIYDNKTGKYVETEINADTVFGYVNHVLTQELGEDITITRGYVDWLTNEWVDGLIIEITDYEGRKSGGYIVKIDGAEPEWKSGAENPLLEGIESKLIDGSQIEIIKVKQGDYLDESLDTFCEKVQAFRGVVDEEFTSGTMGDLIRKNKKYTEDELVARLGENYETSVFVTDDLCNPVEVFDVGNDTNQEEFYAEFKGREVEVVHRSANPCNGLYSEIIHGGDQELLNIYTGGRKASTESKAFGFNVFESDSPDAYSLNLWDSDSLSMDEDATLVEDNSLAAHLSRYGQAQGYTPLFVQDEGGLRLDGVGGLVREAKSRYGKQNTDINIYVNGALVADRSTDISTINVNQNDSIEVRYVDKKRHPLHS